MSDVQADSNRPEDDAYADARAAFDEVTKGPAEEVVEAEAAPLETAQETADRARDEKGRFAAKEEKAEVEVKAEVATTEQPVEPVAPVEQAVQQPSGAPPGGFSVKTKAEWDKLPDFVRADIVKREQEVNEGFKQYEGMRELRPYVEMAQRSGTSLKAALDNYTGLENLLRQDVVKGVSQIASNMGTHPVELAHRILQAYGQTAQPASVDPSGAQPFDPSVLQQHINPLAQELQQIKHQLSQRDQAEQARQQTVINTAVERFQADPAHRYFENVKPIMAQLMNGGVVPETGDFAADLRAAYEAACYQVPEIRDQLINDRIAKDTAASKQREKDAAEKARQASRSITGSPSAAVREADSGKRGSAHDDARAAWLEASARV